MRREIFKAIPPFIIAGALALVFFTTRYSQSEGQQVDDLHIRLRVDPTPARVGDNTVLVQITTGEGQMLQPVRVVFKYFPVPPAYMIPQPEPVAEVEAMPAGDGVYQASLHLTRPEKWKLAVEAYRPDRPRTTAWFTIDVQ